MSVPELYLNIAKVGLGIDACLEKKLYLPALILIYSGIDIAGWLASPEPFASQKTFVDWVDAYLLKAKALPCTALELWGARCGLVHTLTPFSRPPNKPPRVRPRIIWPVFGTACVEDIQKFIELKEDSERYVAVHINDLYEAWRLGTLRFIMGLDADPKEKAVVVAKAKKFFAAVSPELMKLASAELEEKRRRNK
jgi:hypothetical protein